MIQIEVANHFNEDAFSHGLAEGLAERLRIELRDVSCAEHNEEPTIRLATDGVAQILNDIHIEVDGCCDAAITRVQAVIDQIREETA